MLEKKPKKILDVGSYRLFIIGLLAHYNVTTVDVRPRDSSIITETVITCDAKRIEVEDESFDMVISLCALEHFGLGRYGDPFDPDADLKAFKEWVRLLKKGGLLVYTTSVNKSVAAILFNAGRIYTTSLLHDMCRDLICVEEVGFDLRKLKYCELSEVTDRPGEYDIYLGCWKKP